MSVSDKIRALMTIRGKKNIELAAYLNLSPQSAQNKLSRGSFSAEDLIKIADFLDCTIYFEIDNNQRLVLDKSDIRNRDATEEKTDNSKKEVRQ